VQLLYPDLGIGEPLEAVAGRYEVDGEALDELAAIPPEVGSARLAAGNDLWLVHDGPTSVFSCWTFYCATPVVAARRGSLDLPAGTVCLEHSITAPHTRGRGVAPAAWVRIAETLEQRGVERLITKVDTDNAPSRRAVSKAGFKAFAIMRFGRVGPLSRVRMQPVGESGPQSLFARLSARLGAGVDRARAARTARA